METHERTTIDRLRIVVSRDRMRAWIETPEVTSPLFSVPSEHEIVSAMAEKAIEINDGVRERVRQYLDLAGQAASAPSVEGRPEVPTRFLVAEGEPPVEARDGEFVWDDAFKPETREQPSDTRVDYYSMNSILTIKAGKVIGEILPPRVGMPGRDIHGREAPPRRAKGTPIKLGHGLRLTEDGSRKVVTETAGRLEQDGLTLVMRDVLTISRDVDFKSGNIDAVVDVHVNGGVRPNFSVKTSGSITINKDVEGAELDAGGDITVRRGLFGQETEHRITAKGSVSASICDGVHLEAGGDVCVGKEIINSRIRAHGEVRIENGSLVGGQVYARNGVKAKHIGSEAGVTTRIAVGIEGVVLYRAEQMDQQARKRREKAEKIRTRVKPLLANVKRLGPSQREQATELMCKADDVESAVAELIEERSRMIAHSTPDEPAGVEFTGTMHPGAVLVFGLREASINHSLKGPARIEQRVMEQTKEIVVINQQTGDVTLLPSAAVDVSGFSKPDAGASNGNQ